MTKHGLTTHRGMARACSHANITSGRFRRMFPELPPLYYDPKVYHEVGKPGGAFSVNKSLNPYNSNIPLGYCFLGQFIDHDMTLDISSSLERVNDPEDIANVRSPALDLDSLYGQGRVGSRHQYWFSSSSDFDKAIRSGTTFLVDNSDLPRSPTKNGGAALIGDPRNDENRILSQLHLAFLKFHNRIVDALLNDMSGSHAPRPGYRERLKAMGGIEQARNILFEDAQKMTRWHYQWVILHDFLQRLCYKSPVPSEDPHGVLDHVLAGGRKVYTCISDPYIPIEFAVAVYRFGHCLVPETIHYNAKVTADVFSDELGNGFERVPKSLGLIDWSLFFGPSAQKTRGIGASLANSLLELPFIPDGEEKSLATRNLLRSQSFGLPSAEAVIKAMTDAGAIEVYDGEGEIKAILSSLSTSVFHDSFPNGTPLWVYVMTEGFKSRLGPVGSRIVAEVLIGLLECDPTSFLASNRSWRPELVSDAAADWNMEKMITFIETGTIT